MQLHCVATLTDKLHREYISQNTELFTKHWMSASSRLFCICRKGSGPLSLDGVERYSEYSAGHESDSRPTLGTRHSQTCQNLNKISNVEHWRWRQYVAPKRLYPHTTYPSARRHNATVRSFAVDTMFECCGNCLLIVVAQRAAGDHMHTATATCRVGTRPVTWHMTLCGLVTCTDRTA